MPLTPEQRIRRELTSTRRLVEKLEARVRELEAGNNRHTRRGIWGDGKPYNCYLLFWTGAKTPLSRMPGIKYVAALPDETTDAGYLVFIDDAGTETTLAIDESLYAKLLGRAGGQTLAGGTASGENLILKGTTHATPGAVGLNSAGSVFVSESASVIDTAGYTVKFGADDELVFPATHYSHVTAGSVINTFPACTVKITNSEGTATVQFTLPVTAQRAGHATKIRAVTLHYELAASGFIDQATLSQVDISAGSASTIEDHTANITSGTSYAFTGLPVTLSTTEALHITVLLDASTTGSDEVVLRGVAVQWDTD